MEPVLKFLREWTEGDLLGWTHQVAAAETYGLSVADVERIALENGILPGRYQRNRRMLSTEQQLRLFGSTAAVIGCGGLGGYILEELARLGVGKLIAIDPDVFEEHNLNRQLLATPESLGRPKVEAAAERIASVNPAVTLVPHQKALGAENGLELLEGADIVVDGLDNISVRLELSALCRELNIPLVHGAIAGWYGQVATQFPGENTIETLFGGEGAQKGVETELGNPSFTPAVIASIEVAEVCKVLLGEGEPLRRRTLAIDLRDMEFVETLL